MSWGHESKRGVFGDVSEFYASNLFRMLKNPDHMRRPDLISVNGRYDPRLSIELKSGTGEKGSLVETQLHYAISSADDYQRLYGKDLQAEQGLLPGEVGEAVCSLPSGPVAYYYGLVARVDSVTSKDLDRPGAAIRIRYGDQYVVPHQFGFIAFALEKSRKTGEPIKDVIAQLQERMRRDVVEKKSHHEERDENSWQDLHGRDIRAIWLRDYLGKRKHPDDIRASKKRKRMLLTDLGRQRVAMIRQHYQEVERLKRIEIPGPNNTTIYVLAYAEHQNLFDRQFRGTIGRRIPVIERVTKERRLALGLLDRIAADPGSNGLFHRRGVKETPIQTDLPEKELHRLRRLTMWLDEGEEEIYAPDRSELSEAGARLAAALDERRRGTLASVRDEEETEEVIPF